MHIPVFVSSRFEEFRVLRAALREQLEATGVFAALALDDGSAAPVSVADRSVGTVADAEVVVLLLGSTYADDPNVQLSLTHREYRRARELQRTLLVYEPAAASDTSRDPRARAFRQEVLDDGTATIGSIGDEPETDAVRIVDDLERLLLWQATELHPERVGELARYVGAEHVERMWLNEPRALEIRRSASDPVAGARALTGRLLEIIAERGFAYRDDPVRFGTTQRVRHPTELDVSAGTHLDLAVLVASVGIAHELAPILAVGRRDDQALIWVVFDLGRDPRRQQADARPLRRLMTDRDRREQSEAPATLAVDVRALATSDQAGRGPEESAAEALRRGQQLLTDEPLDEVLLVDVLAQHQAGARSFLQRPSEQLPAITRMLPPAPRFRSLGSVRDEVLEKLHEARGMTVLAGPSGVGKSMLALKAAADADGGFGWFLTASSRAELDIALAEVESLHAGERLDLRATSPRDLSSLAQRACQRLEASQVPWVVVIDNADLPPEAVLPAVPKPDAARGQVVLITTTDRDERTGAALGWRQRIGQVIELEPLHDELAGYPAPLQVHGRPLLSTAFDALSAATGKSLEELAGAAVELPSQLDGPGVLWALARRYMAPEVRTMALLMALSPPDRLDQQRLAAAHTSLHHCAASREAYETVCGLGLAQPWWPGTARMHRRVGRAVADDCFAQEPTAGLDAIGALLDAGIADQESLTLMAERLTDESWSHLQETREQRGSLLHRIGLLVEPVRGVRDGLALMRAAQNVWSQGPATQQADRLHAEARLVFQHDKRRAADGLQAVADSIAHRDRAIEVCSGDDEEHRSQLLERWRSVALRGMLLVEQASAALRDADLSREEVDAALRRTDEGAALVDEALDERRRLLEGRYRSGQVDPDLLRGEYNQAFTAVNIAQQPQRDVADRQHWLSRAERHYANVLQGRLRLRSAPTAQLAASHAGFALVDYLRATTPGADPVQAAACLREAAGHLRTALAMRESVEPVDGNEVAKTSMLEVKIALARVICSHANRSIGEDAASKELVRLGTDLQRELGVGW